MKKSELRSGYLVENNKGQKGIIMLLEGINMPHSLQYCIVGDGKNSGRTWMPLSNLNEELVFQKDRDCFGGITKVWSRSDNMSMASFSYSGRELLWERKVKLFLTQQEAVEKLSEIMGKDVIILPEK